MCYPQEVIPTFDMCINEMFYERYPAAVLEHQIQVRPFNAEKTKNMRSLNPEGMFVQLNFNLFSYIGAWQHGAVVWLTILIDFCFYLLRKVNLINYKSTWCQLISSSNIV